MHNYPRNPHASGKEFGHKPSFELGQEEAENGLDKGGNRMGSVGWRDGKQTIAAWGNAWNREY